MQHVAFNDVLSLVAICRWLQAGARSRVGSLSTPHALQPAHTGASGWADRIHIAFAEGDSTYTDG